MTPPFKTFIVIALTTFIATALTTLTACDSEEPPAPVAAPPAAPPAVAAAQAPPISEAEREWQSALARAKDDDQDPFNRSWKLERLVKDAAEDDPHLPEAKRLMAKLTVLGKTQWAVEKSVRETKRLPRSQWELPLLLKKDLHGLVTMVLYDQLLSCKYPRKGDNLDPIDVKAPYGDDFQIRRRVSVSDGLGSAGNLVYDLLRRAGDAEGAPASWSKGWEYRNAAVNDLLRRELGGDLFDAKHSGRLNRKPAKRLAAKANKLVRRKYFDLPMKTLVFLHQDSLRLYDDSYAALDRYGLDKGVAEYRAAYAADANFYRWHRRWVEKNGIAKEVGLDSYYSAVAVGFWLRRLDDGTAPLWRALLTKATKLLPSQRP